MSTETPKTKRALPNTNPDKREMLSFREMLKTLFILMFGIFITATFFIYYGNNNLDVNPDIVLTEKEPDVVTQTKKEINYSDLKVVIKTSKDIHKYFVSYKKYYSKENYNIIVNEISFSEYMLINTNDTLTATKFK